MKTGEFGYELRKKVASSVGRVGKKPSITIWDNDPTVGDTVYIGSRASDKYIRIYDKHNEQLEFLRYECEFKRNIASRIWEDYCGNESALSNWLSSTILASIREFEHLAEMIRVIEASATSEVWIEVEERDDEKTLRWLKRQVTPAAVRLSMTDQRIGLMKWLEDLSGMV